MVALGFTKDTRISILLNSATTDMMKEFYAARGATIYALKRMSVKTDTSTTKATSNQQGLEGEESSIFSEIAPTEGSLAPTTDDETSEDNISQDEDEKILAIWIPSKTPYSIQIGNADCDVYLYDEGGKININNVDDDNRDIYSDFFTEKGVDMVEADAIVDSILDWIDPDDFTHINGAEDGYYESLPEPYSAKNAAFDSVEELTLVRGITPEIFESIRDDITVYGSKQFKININFASKEVLSSIPGLTGKRVDDLMLYIEENGPFKDFEELRETFWSLGIIGDSYEDIKSYITIGQSDFVSIRAVCRDSEITSTAPDDSDYTSEQSGSSGYEYKLIANKGDSKYEIMIVYPE